MKRVVLTIGGSDSWAGGGVATDLKTMEAFGVFGVMALTCVAVADDVQGFVIRPLDAELFKQQLATLEASYDFHAIKIGLISTIEMVDIVSEFLSRQTCPIVVDPVLAFKETDERYDAAYVQGIAQLCRQATVITPNLVETMMLSGVDAIHSLAMAEEVGQQLHVQLGVPVIVKGGGRLATEGAIDILCYESGCQLFAASKLAQPTVNGAGCSFASAIAANLAQGVDLITAINRAKDFVHCSIENGYILKDGSGNVWYGGCKYER
ncbi:hydroxymethylpyrimidine/phosphomethylpyrimidine kinase [Aerococcaceae bacterium NML210727]|nr:hydroxymethylpyrimidine/phosphomethylpyrimidine kinase [Aerococcaceae bacterium NML210727]MCW6653968.1 hydroxymethylpyrimidine/phosphomethylpyrimidine kinase [Aerococcaceae bacterium NML201296]